MKKQSIPMPRLRVIILLIALFMLAACADGQGGLTLFSPEVSVTPASAPIAIPGVTPVIPTDGPAATLIAEAAAELAPTAVETPTNTPTPERTPVRLKAPASPPERPTDTATPSVSPTVTDTPTATPTAVPTETLTPTDTAAPTETATSSPAPTNTPVVVTATATTAPEVSPAEPTPEPTVVAIDRPLGLDHTLNILIVGSDERVEGQPWRSDVIMLAAVDFANREVGVISFPRDLWVSIPTVGENRINTATFFGDAYNYKNGGGIGLLSDTLAQNFGVRVDHFVKIDFKSYKDVVDALGGIDVVVDCPMYGRFPREPGSTELIYQTLQPGEYHMDGLFALRYARERKSTSDVDRARRQQRVLIAIRNRAREINIIPRLPALYDALRGTIETDLGFTDIIALARLGIQIDPKDAHGFIIDFRHTDSWTTPEGAAVLLPRMQLIQDGILHLFEQNSILESPSKPRSCQ
ncbi:MAG: LCP family protein [Caldilineales bacterium]|nr:LCP family protein [Caldilineales bacterium]